jgi:tRNA(fMet)-specific endonuclease VapC
MYALDTNTVLDYFKGKGNVGAHLLATPPGEIALPAVAAYEVWVGVLGSQNAKRRQAEYEQFLSVVGILPFDAVAGRRAADLRIALERKGEAIGPMDTLIAATALAHGATLVTRNVREFGRVPSLTVVNWHDG